MHAIFERTRWTLRKNTTPSFSGTAEAGSTVKIYRAGTTLVGSGVTDSSGNWTIATSGLPMGVSIITTTATDVAGNVSVASSGFGVKIDRSAFHTIPSSPPRARVWNDKFGR